ncbi:MAG: hypothetical protein AAB250_02445 [Bdellovibrionota bacterium]
MGLKRQPHEIISSSRLLTRACLAGYTAESLLISRPRAPLIRGWIGFLAWALFILCVMSTPISTSAYSELATRAVTD